MPHGTMSFYIWGKNFFGPSRRIRNPVITNQLPRNNQGDPITQEPAPPSGISENGWHPPGDDSLLIP